MNTSPNRADSISKMASYPVMEQSQSAALLRQAYPGRALSVLAENRAKLDNLPMAVSAQTATALSGILNLPISILKSVSTIAHNLGDLSDSVRTQRKEDQSVGLGIIAGARSFSGNVRSFYEHLGKINTDNFNRENFLPHIGEIAKQFMVDQAGERIFDSLATHFPDSLAEIRSVFGSNTSLAVKPVIPSLAELNRSAAMQSTSTIGSVGAKVLGWAGAAYSLYEIFSGKLDPQGAALSGAAAGAYIGSAIMPGVGTIVGAALGGVGGFLSGMFKSGKSVEQKERDAIRKELLSSGIIDSNWNIALANGAMFDLGKDGGARLKNKDGGERKYTELDMYNPLSEQIEGVAAPLAQALCGNNSRLAREFSAYFTNASLSNTDSIEGALLNMQAIYNRFGIPLERVLIGLSK